MRILMLGAPGVGKGSQAKQLSKALSVPHISTGDIFREHIAQKTDLGNQVKAYMTKGMLVPDEITVAIVAERLQKSDCQDGFILDGFPRTVVQAQTLDTLLGRMNARLDIVVNIVLDENSIIRRITGRCICSKCGDVYHMDDRVPRSEGVCDQCGSALVRRDDDSVDTIRKRIHIYALQTEPLIAYYQDSTRVVSISSEQSLETTTSKVFEAVGIGLSHPA